jgi:AAA15 family ATPase/GTPase
MFTQITLKNYRSHKLTTINLSPITLLIGNNNSGKSNLLSGIQHFSNLVKRGRLENSDEEKRVYAGDIFNHKYRLAPEPEPMEFEISWKTINGTIDYKISLWQVSTNPNLPPYNSGAICEEKISIRLSIGSETVFSTGDQTKTNLLTLRQEVSATLDLEAEEKALCLSFFDDFKNILTYHFQPYFLKQNSNKKLDRSDFPKLSSNDLYKIPAALNTTGQEFQALVRYIKENEEKIYTRFVALLRRFESNFQSIRYEELQKKLLWAFDLGQKGKVEEFYPDSVSDGFMKAAAISLLASFDRPPTLILLEEIENGINPGNIQELMRWLWQMTSPNSEGWTTQFIITSHSPSVLREFHNHLDHVYTVRLQKRDRTSDVRNLNTSLDTLVGIGTVEGEIIEDETTGKRIVEIPKYQLAELWYSGTIG